MWPLIKIWCLFRHLIRHIGEKAIFGQARDQGELGHFCSHPSNKGERAFCQPQKRLQGRFGRGGEIGGCKNFANWGSRFLIGTTLGESGGRFASAMGGSRANLREFFLAHRFTGRSQWQIRPVMRFETTVRFLLRQSFHLPAVVVCRVILPNQ